MSAPSNRPFSYAKMPSNWTPGARGRCVVCLRQTATRYLVGYIVNSKNDGLQNLRLCDDCEPGTPCAAFPALKSA